MAKPKHKRLSKRERQRITTIRERHGSDAFSRFGKKGGRGNKVDPEVAE